MSYFYNFLKKHLKDNLRLIVHNIHPFLNVTSIRFLLTYGYRSPFVAIGETNSYGIAPWWITIDLADADFNVDLRKQQRLPFEDNSRSVCYCAHIVEHLDDDTLAHCFKETYRILKPGGIFRIEAPDCDRLLDAFERRDLKMFQPFIAETEQGSTTFDQKYYDAFLGLLSCYIVDNKHRGVSADMALIDEKFSTRRTNEEFVQWALSLQTNSQRRSGGHINYINHSKLDNMLQEAGFYRVYHRQNRESLIKKYQLVGIERSHRAFYSLYIEAVKSP